MSYVSTITRERGWGRGISALGFGLGNLQNLPLIFQLYALIWIWQKMLENLLIVRMSCKPRPIIF